jgi:hypothetical protein
MHRRIGNLLRPITDIDIVANAVIVDDNARIAIIAICVYLGLVVRVARAAFYFVSQQRTREAKGKSY